MRHDLYPVTVIFRKYKDTGDVFAIFPYEIANSELHVTTYEHIGQHSAGNYQVCIDISKPARSIEYASLARELTSLGYVLDIKTRVNASKQSDAYRLELFRGAK